MPRFSFITRVAWSQSHPALLVNFIAYWEIRPGKTQHFSGGTDFTVTPSTVMPLMRGGRPRWKVENETFNPLKNQGYHFAHHFGHGPHHRAVVFAVFLMKRALLVDQIQLLGAAVFQAALKKTQRLCRLWEQLRAAFTTLDFPSMAEVLEAIVEGYSATLKIRTSG